MSSNRIVDHEAQALDWLNTAETAYADGRDLGGQLAAAIAQVHATLRLANRVELVADRLERP